MELQYFPQEKNPHPVQLLFRQATRHLMILLIVWDIFIFFGGGRGVNSKFFLQISCVLEVEFPLKGQTPSLLLSFFNWFERDRRWLT